MNLKIKTLILVFASITCLNTLAMEQQPSALDRQLILATQHGDLVKMTEALNAGAHINGPVNGFTPLEIAIKFNQLPALKLLVEKGADINQLIGINSTTPLIRLTGLMNRSDMIKYLLDHGAQVNTQDSIEYTALHHAATYSQLNTILALLAQNANPNIRTNSRFVPVKNATPLDLAIAGGHNNARIILENLALTPDEIKRLTNAMLTLKGTQQLSKDVIKSILLPKLSDDIAQEKFEKIQKELPADVWETIDKELLMKALKINVKRGFGLPNDAVLPMDISQ